MDPTARQRAVPGTLNSRTRPMIPASAVHPGVFSVFPGVLRCSLLTSGARDGDDVSRVDVGTGRISDGRIGAERSRSNRWC